MWMDYDAEFVGYEGFPYYGNGRYNFFGFPYHQWINYDYYQWGESDKRIQQDIVTLVRADKEITERDKNRIEVTVQNGDVKLSGIVSSIHSKWSAFDDAYWLPGVIDVHNALQISETP